MIDIITFVEIKQQLNDFYKQDIQNIKTLQELQKWINQTYYLDISTDEAKVLFDFFNSSDETIIERHIIEQCDIMSDEERVSKIIELNQWNNFEEHRKILNALFKSIEDKDKILDIFETMMWLSEDLQELFGTIDKEIVAEYLKSKCVDNKRLINLLIDRGEILDILKVMEDIEKTKVLLNYLGPISGNIIDNDIKRAMVHEIEDEYCRKQVIIFFRTEKIFNVEDFKNNISEYEKIKEQIEQIKEEKEKIDFITTLEDNDLKLQFLKQVKTRENRNIIISSLTRNIDPKIEPQVALVEKMIREFFEDKMGNSMSEEQKEKLDIALKKTSVNFENLPNGTNGISYNLEDKVSISTRHCNNLSKTIQFLLHEYGHIFSLQNIKTENYYRNKDIDEGMQDVFLELVVNHWIEKYGQIKVGDRAVSMEYPCKSYSGYDIENSWARTMLYPLEKQGKDVEAVTEYLLGDKNKFLELTLGKENAETKPIDLFGNHEMNVTWEEIYERMLEGFEEDDISTSIYRRKNNFISIFSLQKKLQNTEINFFELKGEDKYRCAYIADKYFQGRKIYQISQEEMKEFCDLYNEQKEMVISQYWEFFNDKIDEISEEEILEYSAEVLETSIVLAKDVTKIGNRLENLWCLALEEERQKIEKGQNVKETAIKYKKIINDYLTLLSGIKSDASEFLMDAVKDLKYTYLKQMEECITKGNVQEVLEGLRNVENGMIYADTDIVMLFEKLGVKFEQIQMMGSYYTSQDIVESAVKGTLKLDDVKRISLILENDKSDELVGEISDGK